MSKYQPHRATQAQAIKPVVPHMMWTRTQQPTHAMQAVHITALCLMLSLVCKSAAFSGTGCMYAVMHQSVSLCCTGNSSTSSNTTASSNSVLGVHYSSVSSKAWAAIIISVLVFVGVVALAVKSMGARQALGCCCSIICCCCRPRAYAAPASQARHTNMHV